MYFTWNERLRSNLNSKQTVSTEFIDFNSIYSISNETGNKYKQSFDITRRATQNTYISSASQWKRTPTKQLRWYLRRQREILHSVVTETLTLPCLIQPAVPYSDVFISFLFFLFCKNTCMRANSTFFTHSVSGRSHNRVVVVVSVAHSWQEKYFSVVSLLLTVQ